MVEKTVRTLSVGIVSLAVSASALAFNVRPEALQFQEYEQGAEGQKMAIYAVRCSNREMPMISKTVGEREWCAADGTCFTRKIKAAKLACQLGVDETRLAENTAKSPR